MGVPQVKGAVKREEEETFQLGGLRGDLGGTGGAEEDAMVMTGGWLWWCKSAQDYARGIWGIQH